MDELYQHSQSCFEYLNSLQPLGVQIQVQGDAIAHCFKLTDAIHAQPWILGGVPYPIIKAASEAIAFHGVMLLLTKMFTLGA